jgi:hypothetical protein
MSNFVGEAIRDDKKMALFTYEGKLSIATKAVMQLEKYKEKILFVSIKNPSEELKQ